MADELKELFALIKGGEINDGEARERLKEARAKQGNRAVSAGIVAVEKRYSASHPWFQDHIVSDVPVLPGAVLMDQVVSTFKLQKQSDRQLYSLKQVGFLTALIPQPNGEAISALALDGQKYVNGSATPSKSDFTLTDAHSGAVLAMGRVELEADDNWWHPLEFPSDLELHRLADHDAIYGLSDKVKWGDHFKTLTELAYADVYASSRFELKPRKSDQTCLDPRIINSAFLSALGLFPSLSLFDDYLPVSIKALTCDCDVTFEHGGAKVIVTPVSDELITFDADIFADDGRPVAAIRGFTLKRVPTLAKLGNAPAAVPAKPEVEKGSDPLEAWLAAHIKKHLPAVQGALPRRKNFMDLGVTSASLMEIVKELEVALDLMLNPTLLFEYPNLATLAQFLRDEHPDLGAKVTSKADQHTPPAPAPALDNGVSKPVEEKGKPMAQATPTIDSSNDVDDHAIAIIGMNGRFAGANTIDQFWENLTQEKDLVSVVPPNHWDVAPWYDPDTSVVDKTYCKWGTFIEDVDLFDAEFFNISPREAKWMDPQLRILLECAYHAIEDAGVITQVRGSDTGVFVGACFHDYSAKMTALGLPMEPYMGTGNSHTVLANRLSFLFNLNGPSIAYDTACSSSLVALHAACVALRNRECSMAVVGGTNLLLDSAHYRYFSSLRALSPTGRCHSFDARADGYVPGECVGSVILKPLHAALRDNDNVQAIIRGSATSHGGYTPSLTAPSVDGEANVILKAWDDAKIDPRDISYVEAHGTGTPLGDPIEMTSLAKAFRKHTKDVGFCSVGTAKANIGHTEGAAGIAGLIKTVTQIRKGVIPRLASMSTLNPSIRLQGTALRIGESMEHWPSEQEKPRTAGISSFGFSGAYAHVVVQEFVDDRELPKEVNHSKDQPELILLSAKSKPALQAHVGQLADWLGTEENMRLSEIACSLQTGREAFDCRLALVVGSVSDLHAALRSLLDNWPDLDFSQNGRFGPELDLGQVALSLTEHYDEDEHLKSQSNLSPKHGERLPNWRALGADWLRGRSIEWRSLRAEFGLMQVMVPVPKYPFESKSYWLDEDRMAAQSAADAVALANGAQSVPSLTFAFSADDPFLRDHQLRDVPVLPGVCYVDMLAQAAVSGAADVTSPHLDLLATALRWRRPLNVTGPVEVCAAFSDPSGGSSVFSVKGGPKGEPQSDHPYFEAKLAQTVPATPTPLDVERLKGRLRPRQDLIAECKTRFASVGLYHGPQMQSLREIWSSEDELLARLESCDGAPNLGMLLDPAAADGALQAIMALVAADADAEFHGALEVPSGADVLHLSVAALTELGSEEDPKSYWARCAMVDVPRGGAGPKYDVSLYAASGAHLMSLQGLSVEQITLPATQGQATPYVAEKLAEVGDEGLAAFTMDLLKKTLAKEAQLEAGDVDPSVRLERYGIDSVMITGMAGQLEKLLGPVSRAAFFESQTLNDLNDHFVMAHGVQLRALLKEQQGEIVRPPQVQATKAPEIVNQAPQPQPEKPVSVGTHQAVPIAVIGVAGSYAGARDLDALWENLRTGQDSISGLPKNRWSASATQQEQAKILGGFVKGAAEFDARFFGIAPKDAPYFDPQERIFLQTAYHTLEDAGYTAEALADKTVGVMVGVMYEEYQLYSGRANGTDMAIGGVAASIANRISYNFNFSGLSMTVDTMCSSSLTAIHLACQSIAQGDLDLALAGGVNLSVHPNKYRFLQQGKFLASDGRCRSFGSGGDGYVPGEGVGCVLLKRLDQAVADNDNIQGVILGSAVNHGGRTHGFSVPSPRAQAEVATRALVRAGVPAQSINYIETHGTGTALGDPIEIHGLQKVYGAASEGRVAIGSVKSNIGHCESAAGIAGLSKILLQMRNLKLAPSLHAAPPNPDIDFVAAGLHVNESLTHWEAPDLEDAALHPDLRRAALSSFGAGGSNAHMIVERYVPAIAAPAVADVPSQYIPIFLSARTPEQLRTMALNLRDRLTNNRLAQDYGFALHDVAFTLSAGRTPMQHRWATMAGSLQELEAKLTIWIDDAAKPPEWQAPSDQNLNVPLRGVVDIEELCEKWVNGTNITWAEVNQRISIMDQPRRVSLPGYPFDRKTYWVSEPTPGGDPQPPVQRQIPTSEPAAAQQTLLMRETWQNAPMGEGRMPSATLTVLVSAQTPIPMPANLADQVHQVALSAHAPQAQMLDALLDEVPVILGRLSDRRKADQGARLQIILIGETVAAHLGDLKGFIASISQEAGNFDWRLVTQAQEASLGDLVQHLQLLEQAPWNVQLKLEQGGYQQMMWEQIPSVEQPVAPWREGGVYVITGGAGGIGLTMAQEIVDRLTHCRVYLLGRSAPSDALKAKIDAMGTRTAQVFFERLNVTDEQAVTAFFASFVKRGERVRGVLHSAGVLRDVYFANRKNTDFAQVLSPKLFGIHALCKATAQLELDFMVAFSSIAHAFGNAGQSLYALANGAMEGYLERQAKRSLHQGTKYLSIAWPYWSEGGMSLRDDSIAFLRRATGLAPLANRDGIDAFYKAMMQNDTSRLMVLSGDQTQLMSTLVPQVAASLPAAEPVRAGAAQMTPNHRERLEDTVQDKLRSLVALQLELPQSEVGLNDVLIDLGYDSVSLAVFATKLHETLGVTVQPTLFYEHQTIAALSVFLLDLHSDQIAAQYGDAVPARTASPASAATGVQSKTTGRMSLKDPAPQPVQDTEGRKPQQQDRQTHREAIAVVGISCNFPKSENLEAFWGRLRDGENCITETPAERWDWGKLSEVSGADCLRWGGFIDGLDHFDAGFFRISGREALLMEPSQRLLMTHVWKTIEDAGYAPSALAGSKTALLVGTGQSGYADAGLRDISDIEGYSATGAVASVGPNRVSYFLDLKGPSEPVETACSSSLVAIHRAIGLLRSGEVDVALTGGVNTLPTPTMHLAFNKAGMLSGDGSCKTFSTDANGYVRSEGVGVLMLKRLSDAQADGDHIYGLLRGSAQNHGGRSSSLTAPNPTAQAELLQTAYADAEIDASTVGYIEAHGTGTPLGDPIEMNGLQSGFAQLGVSAARGGDVVVGSVKSNIGHAELASGVAGVIKVLLQMQHETIVKSLHSDQINPQISLDKTGFRIAQTQEVWARKHDELGRVLPLRAGVSSFGFGGVNAHIVLEEFVEDSATIPQSVSQDHGPAMIVLSAKSEAQVREQAAALATALSETSDQNLGGAYDAVRWLHDFAYTLQVGRDPMKSRVAFVVDTKAALTNRLEQIAAGQTNVPDVTFGTQQMPSELMDLFENGTEMGDVLVRLAEEGKQHRLVRLWANGINVDWSKLSVNQTRRRLSLPGYAFRSDSYWLPQGSALFDAAPERNTQVQVQQPNPQPAVVAPSLSGEQDVKGHLVSLVASVMHLDEAVVETNVSLEEFGFDSISLTEFAKALNEQLGIELEPTVFFEHTSIDALSSYLSETYQDKLKTVPQPSVPSPAAAKPAQIAPVAVFSPPRSETSMDGPEPIAIVGMSACLPGSPDLDAYWKNLKEGRDCITEVPIERWDWRKIYGDQRREPGKTNVKWGGFIDSIAEFDPLFFSIAPREAAQMDPQHRLLMTHCWTAIEDAGYSADTISGTSTGVFLATSTSNGYTEISLNSGAEIESHTATGIISSVGPNRISYFLNLTGPSEPVETACSSSLVALHRAVAGIRSGECDMALVGGVNTMSNEAGHLAFSKAGMLSERGRCRSFSSGADGYVRGEGVGVVFIKRLSQAEKDGDRIYGLVRGSAVNHGGRANSLTAPNPAAQADLISKALRNAAVDPSTVTYVEAHGTGTALGDPIEIDGLKRAFAASDSGAGKALAPTCAIGSVKSNIGHLELSAGVAGLAKVLLQLQNKTIVKGVYETDYNPRCDLTDSPFYFAEKEQHWPALIDETGNQIPRRAGVSSFGFGGVNAHVVIEEHLASDPAPQIAQADQKFPNAFVLSAKTPEQLVNYAKLWCDTIDEGNISEQTHRLMDILFVAQTGRRPMEHRLGFPVNSIADIRETLGRISNAEDIANGHWHYGKIKRGRTAQLGGYKSTEERDQDLTQWLAANAMPQILEKWVRGMAVDWSAAYDMSVVKRTRIPTYPFAKTRYWIGDPNSGKTSAKERQPAKLEKAVSAKGDRPLVELMPTTPVSDDPSESVFKWLLKGTERYVLDHIVQGRQVLPGVLVLEAATSALKQLDCFDTKRTLHLRGITWVRPIILDGAHLNIGVVVKPSGDDEWRFTLVDLDNARAGPFSQGLVNLAQADDPQPKAPPLATAPRTDVSASDLYTLFEAAGLAYGPAHQAIKGMQVREGEVVAQLSMPDAADHEGRSYYLHPSLLDCALQTSVGLYFPDGLHADAPAQLALPFALDDVQVFAQCPNQVEARAYFSPDSAADAMIRKADIDLYDLEGQLCVRIKGFSSRVLPSSGTKPVVVTRDVAILGKTHVYAESTTQASSQQNFAEQLVISIGFDDAEIAQHIGQDGTLKTRVVILRADEKDLDTGQYFTQCAIQVADLLRDLLAQQKDQGALANWCLVRLVCRADLDQPLQGLAALLRSAQRENGKVVTQFIKAHRDQLAQLVTVAGDPATPCIELDFSAPQALVPVWQRLNAGQFDPASGSHSPWRAGGRYLITGGAGQLGFLTAMHIAQRAAQPVLILTGRSAPSDAVKAMLDEIRSCGAAVEYISADITDAAQVADMIAQIRRAHGPLNGVIHSAGVLDDELLINKDNSRFARTLSPKVDGLMALDAAVQSEPLDLFVTFSSIAGIFGNAGQCDYAAANAFMDDYMARRSTRTAGGKGHGVSVSVCWPYWENGGMHMSSLAVTAVKQATGMHPLETGEGFEALDQLLGQGDGIYAVLAGQGGKFDRLVSALGVAAGSAPEASTKPQSISLPDDFDSEELAIQVEQMLKVRISNLLEVEIDEIDSDVPLNEFGFDSITLTEFATSMGDEFALELSPTVLFEHPTIDALSGYLADEHPHCFIGKLDDVDGATPPQPAKLAQNVETAVASPQPQARVQISTDPAQLAADVGNVTFYPRLTDVLAEQLGIPVDELVADTPIEDLAIGSIVLTNMAQVLETEFDLKANFDDFFGGETWAECVVVLAKSAQKITHPSGTAAAKTDMIKWDSWTAEVNNRTFAMSGWGGKKEPIAFCLHGFLDQGPVWHSVASQLVQWDWSVMAPDLLGHGLSDHLPTKEIPDFASHLDDMSKLIKAQAGRPVVLIGHSMSALLASQLAKEHSDLLAGLVLIEPIPPHEQQSTLINGLLKGNEKYKHRTLADHSKASNFLKQYIHGLPDDLADALAERITKSTKGGNGIKWTWDARLRRHAYEMIKGVTYKGYLEAMMQLECDPLIIRSTRSGVVTDKHVREMKSKIDGVSVHDFDGGHHLHVDHARETAEKIIQHVKF